MVHMAGILNPNAPALKRAIDQAGGKTELMRKLNDRGHDINSRNVISQWELNGVPAKYCPDIEALTTVRCEELNPDVNWAVLRGCTGHADNKAC
jgi:DNA-binding transcriptional regulator YdaS (Cro superfamily)